MRRLMIAAALLVPAVGASAAGSFVVHLTEVADQKAIIGTVEPVHQLAARARIGGTVATLSVKEGDQVEAGAILAIVGDPKLVMQQQAIDARIQSQESQRDKAQTDYDRAIELQRRGVSTQVQVDAARTALDVAGRTLEAMRSDRGVIDQQMKEGAVLAPSAGRVLKVPVAEGSVILPGETVATIAENHYILRLELPERHARFMRAGDAVQIGDRGASESGARREGRVRLVYPEIEGGRVIADVEAPGVGDYFVGERTRVYVNTGERNAIFVPSAYVYRRAGIDYVKLAGGGEAVVQIGAPRDADIEILSGLKDGDELAEP